MQSIVTSERLCVAPALLFSSRDIDGHVTHATKANDVGAYKVCHVFVGFLYGDSRVCTLHPRLQTVAEPPVSI